MSAIRVLSSLATRTLYLELFPAFEWATGHKVTTHWGGIVDLTKRLKGGESADLVLATADLIDECIASGVIVAGSRVDHATSCIGVAVPADAPRPDMSSGEALRRSLLAVNSVAISSGPSGVYLSVLFERMGIAEKLKGKLIQTPPGVMVGGLLARGKAEIGFQQISELLPVPGIQYIGPLPGDVQHETVFSGGIHSHAKEAAAACELMDFLVSPDVAAAITKHGMETL